MSEVPPWVVALVRGAITAAVIAGLGVLADAGDVAGNGKWAPYAAILALVARALGEGLTDQKRDPTPQLGLTGGRPAVPYATEVPPAPPA